MKTFDIKVNEYGIKVKEKTLPLHYTWEYCAEKKIPYIIIRPKIKYSEIEYDLFTIDDAISFDNESILSDFLSKYYEKYVYEMNLTANKRFSCFNSRHGSFLILKKDQSKVALFLMSKIEEYVNTYGIINPKFKEYFKKIKESHNINLQREKKLHELKGL